MTPPEQNNHGLIRSESSGLIRRMDKRLELVNRILGEIQDEVLVRIHAEMARRFLRDTANVDLSKGTVLDDDAAEILADYGGRLRLDGLTSLSDAAAASLSRHRGRGWQRSLHLSGLTSLSDAAAESLSRHEGELYLEGLTCLSDVAAESLARHRGRGRIRTMSLHLSGLTGLSDAAADFFPWLRDSHDSQEIF